MLLRVSALKLSLIAFWKRKERLVGKVEERDVEQRLVLVLAMGAGALAGSVSLFSAEDDSVDDGVDVVALPSSPGGWAAPFASPW